jgi:hypothetical protein
MAYLSSQRQKKPKSSFLCLIGRSAEILCKYVLETWFSPNYDIRKCLLDMKHGWTKNAFETWIIRNGVNGVSLFNTFYWIKLMACLFSQRTLNVQIKCFMFDWSVEIIFVLKSDWKCDSPQIMIFVNVCWTWSMVNLKTPFEIWITRNVVSGVSLFHLYYHALPVITKVTKCPHQVFYVWLVDLHTICAK